MKDNIRMIKKMAMAFLYGLTNESISAAGKMASNMERAHI